MKTSLILFVLTIAALIAIALTACESSPRVADSTAIAQPKININLDESSAVQIAEIILVRVYGEQVLQENKPWHVTTTAHTYKIEGTLPEDHLGGVALFEISRDNAEVISISHGQ